VHSRFCAIGVFVGEAQNEASRFVYGQTIRGFARAFARRVVMIVV